MVNKMGILFRIQNFQQRSGRVSFEVTTDFVDFIKHNNRVLGFSAANFLDDSAG